MFVMKCQPLKKDDLCLKGNRVNNKHLLCVSMYRKGCCWYCHLYSTLWFGKHVSVHALVILGNKQKGLPSSLLGLATALACSKLSPRQSLGAARDRASILEGPRPGWILISLPWSGFWEKGKRRVWRWSSWVIPPRPQETLHTTWKETKQLPFPQPWASRHKQLWTLVRFPTHGGQVIFTYNFVSFSFSSQNHPRTGNFQPDKANISALESHLCCIYLWAT